MTRAPSTASASPTSPHPAPSSMHRRPRTAHASAARASTMDESHTVEANPSGPYGRCSMHRLTPGGTPACVYGRSNRSACDLNSRFHDSCSRKPPGAPSRPRPRARLSARAPPPAPPSPPLPPAPPYPSARRRFVCARPKHSLKSAVHASTACSSAVPTAAQSRTKRWPTQSKTSVAEPMCSSSRSDTSSATCAPSSPRPAAQAPHRSDRLVAEAIDRGFRQLAQRRDETNSRASRAR